MDVRRAIAPYLAWAILAAGPFLLAPATAAKEKRIVLRQQDVGLEAVEGPKIDRTKARKVLTECRKAFARIANRFALNSGSIFCVGKRRPFWLPKEVAKDPRIWAVLEDPLLEGETGAEAYLRRMQSGQLRIHVAVPGEELTPGDRHRIWREMAVAILVQTGWKGCPHWLREGIAEVMGERGADGGYALLESLKEQLRKNRDEIRVDGVLSATSHGAWRKAGGRAISWALVHMLEETNAKLVPSLFNQSRLLLNHLVSFRSEQRVVEEYTQIVAQQLERSGHSARTLTLALRDWVKVGFPDGSAFRRTAAHKLLKKVKLPKTFGLGIAGRFASRRHVEDAAGNMRHYQPFSGGTATWRLPWPSSMQAYAGVRGRPGTNYALRPTRKEGYYVTLRSWSAGQTGRGKIGAAMMELPTQLTKFGFVLIAVTSPRRHGYCFVKEWQLK
ncbi:MAG: hypothetical protein ACYS99_08560 [Planctomycetota bacterium]